MKSQFKKIIEIAESAYKKFWVRTNNESEKDKAAKKVIRRWQENIVRLLGDELTVYQTKVSVLGLPEKIDLVNLTDRIAYEMKVSGKNPGYEFYKDVFKILIYNSKSKHKIQMLVFITEKSDARKSEKGMAREVIQWAAKSKLGIEIIGV